jgi:hypothetical protein
MPPEGQQPAGKPRSRHPREDSLRPHTYRLGATYFCAITYGLRSFFGREIELKVGRKAHPC